MQNSNSLPNIVKSLCVVKFSGEDCLSFLQGQLSNDIEQLNDCWQFSGYCNPKGRLLAIFRLWKHKNSVYAVVDASIMEAVIKRLQMYVMRSKVVIEVLADAQCLAIIDPELKLSRFSVELTETTHKLNYDGNQLIIELNASEKFCSTSEQGQTLTWSESNILAGLPSISNTSYEMFVPQMVNLDLIGGVSFKKGCYTGQEIVARMHYLGKLKQRMFVCSVEGKATVGEKLVFKTDNGLEKPAGNIVSVSNSAQIALSVVRLEMVELSKNFTLEGGAKLTINNNQPYEFSL